MFKLLRRNRWLVMTLLLASPGIGGWLLPALHPCPADLPWLVDSGGGVEAPDGGHAHHQASSDSDHSSSHHSSGDELCHCIGSCCPSAGPVPPQGRSFTEYWSLQVVVVPTSFLDAVRVDRLPGDYLPPATAPPQV